MSRTSFYYLHPLLAGPIDMWPDHLDRIAAMGFDAVAIAPPFLTGASGDLFVTADHDRLDPRLGTGDAVAFLARLAQEAGDRRLRPMLDIVVDQVAVESSFAGRACRWYHTDTDDEPPDPRHAPRQRGGGGGPGAGRPRGRVTARAGTGAWPAASGAREAPPHRGVSVVFVIR